MSLTTTPVPARTDVGAARPGSAPAERPAGTTRLARATGLTLATGAALWAGVTAVVGVDGGGSGWSDRMFNISSLAFQFGLVMLVALQMRTRATGTGRLARFFLHVEHVLLGLAMVSTTAWIFIQGDGREDSWFMALDAFWPLSMLGMAAIGVRIAIAGRWKGAARVWPVVAESWAPVCVPAVALAPSIAQYVAAGHLLIGYVALGLIMVARPELTGARD